MSLKNSRRHRERVSKNNPISPGHLRPIDSELSMSSLGSATLRLRRPRDTDIRQLVTIERSAFAARYYRKHRFTAQDFAKLIRRKKTFFLVATHKRKVIANLIGELPATTSRRLARLDSIAVAPTWQSRRIGRRLAMTFVATTRRLGYSGLTLEVAVPNAAAQRLFASLGFRKQRRLPKYYSGRIDGIRMTRRFR